MLAWAMVWVQRLAALQVPHQAPPYVLVLVLVELVLELELVVELALELVLVLVLALALTLQQRLWLHRSTWVDHCSQARCCSSPALTASMILQCTQLRLLACMLYGLVCRHQASEAHVTVAPVRGVTQPQGANRRGLGLMNMGLQPQS